MRPGARRAENAHACRGFAFGRPVNAGGHPESSAERSGVYLASRAGRKIPRSGRHYDPPASSTQTARAARPLSRRFGRGHSHRSLVCEPTTADPRWPCRARRDVAQARAQSAPPRAPLTEAPTPLPAVCPARLRARIKAQIGRAGAADRLPRVVFSAIWRDFAGRRRGATYRQWHGAKREVPQVRARGPGHGIRLACQPAPSSPTHRVPMRRGAGARSRHRRRLACSHAEGQVAERGGVLYGAPHPLG